MPLIAIVPVGAARGEILGRLAPIIGDVFGRDVVVGRPVPLPPSAYHSGRRQYFSPLVLDALAEAKARTWERLLGLADVDLFVPELNFIFGQGDAAQGVAVVSLKRLRPTPPDDGLLFRRVVTEAVHELGHSYGLGHCDDAGCVMWFSNTLAETDRKGPRLCVRHRDALTRALGRGRA